MAEKVFTALTELKFERALELLTSERVDFTKLVDGQNPLLLAAAPILIGQREGPQILTTMLRHCGPRVDVGVCDRNKRNLLHYLAQAPPSDDPCLPALVADLCQRGVKRRADLALFTPLHYLAARPHSADGAERLIAALLTNCPKRETFLNARNSGGDTALLIAAGQHHLGVCEALVRLGADLHCQDKEENYAISFAIKQDWMDQVHWFSSHLFRISEHSPLSTTASLFREIVCKIVIQLTPRLTSYMATLSQRALFYFDLAFHTWTLGGLPPTTGHQRHRVSLPPAYPLIVVSAKHRRSVALLAAWQQVPVLRNIVPCLAEYLLPAVYADLAAELVRDGFVPLPIAQRAAPLAAKF